MVLYNIIVKLEMCGFSFFLFLFLDEPFLPASFSSAERWCGWLVLIGINVSEVLKGALEPSFKPFHVPLPPFLLRVAE